MRFWKIYAREYDYGEVREAKLAWRYINPTVISEIRDKEVADGADPICLIEVHHNANASGRDVTSETGYYEIDGMTADEAVLLVEAHIVAAPVAEETGEADYAINDAP